MHMLNKGVYNQLNINIDKVSLIPADIPFGSLLIILGIAIFSYLSIVGIKQIKGGGEKNVRRPN